MKYLLILLVIVSFYACYNSDKEATQVSKIEQTLINSETLMPIEGIKGYLKMNNNTIDSAISDKNGYYSFDVFSFNNNEEYYIQSIFKLYVLDKTYAQQATSKTLYLAPLSWLKVHVKNETPIDSNDKIEFGYFPYVPGVTLVGNQIDSTYVITLPFYDAFKRPEKITFTTTKNGISTFKTIPISMKSFDTTFVKITY